MVSFLSFKGKGTKWKLPEAVQPAKDVIYFLVLLFSFHFLYLGWSKGLGFFPIADAIDWLFVTVAQVLLEQSLAVLAFLGVETYQRGAMLFIHQMQSWVTVAPECITFKQWLHWIVIMVFFPGPLKHKLWYVPVGIIIIHITNLVRIVGLLLIQIPFPGMFHFFHDYIFKTLFYAVIFAMWLIWNEKIRKSQKPIHPAKP
ncbi:MAG TPA: hypothetical protein DCM62_01325 [Bacteroidales bacterium]|nr:hypothetical protein [Bacteroidales bacterium]